MTLLLRVLVWGAAGFVPVAAAQDTGPGPAGLEQQLQLRDAQIHNLQQRLLLLEQRLNLSTNAPLPMASTSGAAAPADAGEADESTRALERALVREGGYVLPPGAVEVEPRLQHTYSGSRGLGIVQPVTGVAQVSERREDQHQTEAALALRFGLPNAWQMSLSVPHVNKQTTATAAALGLSGRERAHGLGDVNIQLSKLIASERGSFPAVLGSVSWQPASGRYHADRLSPGSGFPSVQLGLTAVKRQDPLVFFGGMSHTRHSARTLDAGRLLPGDGWSVRGGALLAASPETSLRGSLELSRYGRMRLNGSALPGSSTLNGILELGLSSVLSPRVSMDLSVGVGVTPDAPDLRLGLAFPIRFY